MQNNINKLSEELISKYSWRQEAGYIVKDNFKFRSVPNNQYKLEVLVSTGSPKDTYGHHVVFKQDGDIKKQIDLIDAFINYYSEV
jgi:glucuronate isomerase